MAVTYKDIDQLTQKASPTGTEKLPVSDTEYITPADITGKSFRLTEMTPESTKDGYYLSSGGSEYESSSFEIRRYAVSAGKVYALSGHFGSSATNIRMILWFNASGSVLKNDYNSGASGVVSEWLKDRLIVSPIGAVTLAVNVQKSNSEYFAVKETDLDIAGMVEVEDFLSKSSTKPLENGIATRSFIEAMPIDPTSEEETCFMKYDGTVVTGKSSYAYRIFPVTPGETYAVTTIFATGVTTGLIRVAIFLDGNGGVLSYSDEGNQRDSVAQYHDYMYTAPADAVSLVVNFRSTYSRAGTVKKVAPPHPACLKYKRLADEAAYQALATKDSGTLYLIP